MVDSVQKIDDDKSYGIDMKSYARAKLADKKQPGSFENVFKIKDTFCYTIHIRNNYESIQILRLFKCVVISWIVSLQLLKMKA
jgi:hypothetical protein